MTTTPPTPPPPTTLEADVVIAGAGPAGLVAAMLFARAGASVAVLEAHDDFLRDFRGDTVHPSTLALFEQLGCLDEFLRLPHDRADTLAVTFADLTPPQTLQLANFARLKGHPSAPCPFVALMPQHVFLEFVHKKAEEYGGGRYRLVRNARVTGLIYEDEDEEEDEEEEAGGKKKRPVVVGVRATTGERATTTIVARAACLVVAADGRRSAVRAAADLPPAIFPGGAPPMDVLWFRVPVDREADPWPGRSQGFVSRGAFLVSLFRGDYYQMGLLCPKGGAGRVRDEGLGAFARRVAGAVPYLTAERVERALPRFFGPSGGGDGQEGEGTGAGARAAQGAGAGEAAYGDRERRDVHVLDVRVDRLPRWWRPGLVCIGDAAHAMSPVGGVGVNLAVQDAVALCNAAAGGVAAAASEGRRPRRVPDALLAAVQRRREMPTRGTQALQVAVQRRVIRRVLSSSSAAAAAAAAAGPGGQGEGEPVAPLKPPLPLRLFDRFPALQWLPARIIGIGFRPERIECPAAVPAALSAAAAAAP